LSKDADFKGLKYGLQGLEIILKSTFHVSYNDHLPNILSTSPTSFDYKLRGIGC